MSPSPPPWLLSLLVTAVLTVGSLVLFVGDHPLHSGVHSSSSSSAGQNTADVAAVLGRREKEYKDEPTIEGHGGVMVPHAADAHAELQEARALLQERNDELEVAALTEARLTAALREKERELAAAKENNVPPPPSQVKGTIAVGGGGGVAPAAGWFPVESVYAAAAPVEQEGDGWEFDESKVKVT